MIPFDTIDVTTSPDMCIEFQRTKNNNADLTTKDKEDKTIETHTVRMENLNSDATYFVLSAYENKGYVIYFSDVLCGHLENIAIK